MTNLNSPSPFARLLETNAAPLPADIPLIHAFLSEPRQAAVQLEERAASLRRQLAETEAALSSLQTFIAQHEGLLAPIRRVPDDVLRDIFLHTLPTNRNTVLAPIEGPLLVAGVCRNWRAIALSMQELWASMHLVVPQEPHMPKLLETIERWVRRGGIVPLRISMRMPVSHLQLGPRHLLSTLVGYSKRWGDVQLLLTDAGDIEPLYRLSPEDVPRLEGLELVCELASTAMMQKLLPTAFLKTSSLRRLTLRCGYYVLPHWQTGVTWSQLTTLIIEMTPIYSHPGAVIHFPYPFLRECTNLRTFELLLTDQELRFTVGVPAETLLFPHLENFSVRRARHMVESEHLFETFTAPKLKNVELDGNVLPSANIPALVRPLSDTHVRSISLSVYDVSTSDLKQALTMLPHLEALSLVGDPRISQTRQLTDSQFLEILLPEASFILLIPKLQSLEILQSHGLADSLILKVLRSRLPLGLKCFKYQTSRRPQLDLRSSLAGLGGMKLELEYAPDDSPVSQMGVGFHREGLGELREWGHYSALVGTELDLEKGTRRGGFRM